MPTLDELRATVLKQRREVYGGPVEEVGPKLAALVASEVALDAAERGARPAAVGGLLFTTATESGQLGLQTTGLEATCHLRMAQVPTAIAHLLDPATDPLLRCKVENGSDVTRRVRITSFVEGYSAQAIETFEIKSGKSHEFDQLPTFFPDRLMQMNELTRATLHVRVDDLDGKVELHRTQAIWLLPRTTAPLAIKDPMTAEWRDLTRYLGAFVTPNEPELEKVLRDAVDLTPDSQFVSYQAGAAGVGPQVKALFDALQKKKLRYVNSVLSFSPEEGWSSQRVRLPRQTLASTNANCIDGTVLFASLLEAITLRPAIVLVPGHAFVAWQTDPADDESWRYLETTLVGTKSFEDASSVGTARASAFSAVAVTAPHLFRRWPLHDLRRMHGVLPME